MLSGYSTHPNPHIPAGFRESQVIPAACAPRPLPPPRGTAQGVWGSQMRACSGVDMEGGPLIWRHLTGLEFYSAHLQPVDVFQQMTWTLHIHFDIFLRHAFEPQLADFTTPSLDVNTSHALSKRKNLSRLGHQSAFLTVPKPKINIISEGFSSHPLIVQQGLFPQCIPPSA